MPATSKLSKAILACRLFVNFFRIYSIFVFRNHKAKRLTLPDAPDGTTRNIVVVGANFAGYLAARIIAINLPPDSPYRVIVVEPNSHFNFTWVLPRFCVVEGGHEHKAFIPYGPHLNGAPVKWVQDRVAEVERESVRLEGSGEDIPYEMLVIATGSGAGDSLPSRVGATSKVDGVRLLRDMQGRIKAARRLLVIGGGAAGVEVATDAKSLYPEKVVTLVHSREAVMHRFGGELQAEALKSLRDLGVELILGDRLDTEDEATGIATLKSGRAVEYDYILNSRRWKQVRCIGQRPNSHIIAGLSKDSITPEGHIKTKPTLQIADDSLPNVYVCGDVAGCGEQNPNARSAMRKAMVAADNVVLATRGEPAKYTYEPFWGEAFIKLTLGMNRSVSHFGDGKTELLFFQKETDPALMSERTWRTMGVRPYEDPEFDLAEGGEGGKGRGT
ncbi:uncharacterized protein DNG_08245 [Cephalotrichum gorgonifer]|uniref:FAD/NAD(P)-binding domain-containing protein n=1 Tax=Cephalotrichum gorgonifer TaxID=2041049 RepID=A0AAE8N5M8_9PEZI|nr:uncharacterized protein DNG_08245 [Cephalotrichum gorgonifer]